MNDNKKGSEKRDRERTNYGDHDESQREQNRRNYAQNEEGLKGEANQQRNRPDLKEDMEAQEKGSYGRPTQNQLREENREDRGESPGTKSPTEGRDAQANREARGFGQPFQNQRNPGQRKPAKGDVDPTE